MSDFHLRTLIRTVMAEPDAPADPGDLAKIVLSRIDSEDYYEALSQAVRATVSQEVSMNRMKGHTSVAPAVPQPTPPRRGHTPSSKVAGFQAIAEEWKARLRHNIFTASGWKFLQDCSADDFVFAASERRERAVALVTNAEDFEKYAAVMEEYKAARFADLPESVQRDLLDSDQ